MHTRGKYNDDDDDDDDDDEDEDEDDDNDNNANNVDCISPHARKMPLHHTGKTNAQQSLKPHNVFITTLPTHTSIFIQLLSLNPPLTKLQSCTTTLTNHSRRKTDSSAGALLVHVSHLHPFPPRSLPLAAPCTLVDHPTFQR